MTETVSTPTTSIAGLVAGTYSLDTAHTEIGFTVRHLMTKVRGTFREFTGEIVVKDSLEESTANVVVELASVHTRNDQRDGHLRSGDFFDAENTPKMTFASTGLKAEGENYVLAGELTIKDVTKPIELAFEFLGVEQNAYGQTVIGFEASTSISRKEWGIDFNVPLEGGKLLIGDKVDIHLDVQAALNA
ncbi:YceI family protein [Kribbella sandramycini]|uniref:Polyisoprenoid-binding protein YceI n=1 Tax=Kribbella sandramycini TaxID=60450 RepID=A0A7Y4KXK9_9ACTN|nr:YceI family protein [Kribbella sandramycini]MBB6567864.1 polyisoprenoid-binding protein YceI [Kribbella sandramycini]NOL39541.1 YceI family protein [Kribbella sandramycini]